MEGYQGKPLRILILHDQRLFREGLRAILIVHQDLEVIADAALPRAQPR